MKALVLVVRVLGSALLLAGLVLIFVGYYGVWREEGFRGLQALLSPFAIVNWLVTSATLLPGIGTLVLAGWLEGRARD